MHNILKEGYKLYRKYITESDRIKYDLPNDDYSHLVSIQVEANLCKYISGFGRIRPCELKNWVESNLNDIVAEIKLSSSS